MASFILSTFLLILHILAVEGANVTVIGQNILVDGVPFRARGVGLNDPIRFDLLKQMGANTVKTYGGPETAAVLDEAKKYGLKVIAGLWIRQTYQGLDYTNATAVDEELATAVGPYVEAYRNHSALLAWSVGNELETGGDWPLVGPVWEKAVQFVRQLDPGHPAMVVIADEYPVNATKVTALRQYVPSAQIIGVDSYGSPNILTLPKRVLAQGWTGPLFLSEYGPLGQWTAPTTPWSAPIEPSSDEKAKLLEEQTKFLLTNENVQGALAFYWGNKTELTVTWHNMLMGPPQRELLRTAEVLAKYWGGSLPRQNRAPRLDANWAGNSSQIYASFNKTQNATVCVKALDPDGNKVKLEFVVMAENSGSPYLYSAQYPASYSGTVLPAEIPKSDPGKEANVVVIGSLLTTGNYRLFVYAKDGQGAGAQLNLPFQVRD